MKIPTVPLKMTVITSVDLNCHLAGLPHYHTDKLQRDFNTCQSICGSSHCSKCHGDHILPCWHACMHLHKIKTTSVAAVKAAHHSFMVFFCLFNPIVQSPLMLRSPYYKQMGNSTVQKSVTVY